jgi:hypothetical protein
MTEPLHDQSQTASPQNEMAGTGPGHDAVWERFAQT